LFVAKLIESLNSGWKLADTDMQKIADLGRVLRVLRIRDMTSECLVVDRLACRFAPRDFSLACRHLADPRLADADIMPHTQDGDQCLLKNVIRVLTG